MTRGVRSLCHKDSGPKTTQANYPGRPRGATGAESRGPRTVSLQLGLRGVGVAWRSGGVEERLLAGYWGHPWARNVAVLAGVPSRSCCSSRANLRAGRKTFTLPFRSQTLFFISFRFVSLRRMPRMYTRTLRVMLVSVSFPRDKARHRFLAIISFAVRCHPYDVNSRVFVSRNT